MKTLLLQTDTPSSCEPLTSSRTLGECLVGGERLIDIQQKQFLEAGIEEVIRESAGTVESDKEKDDLRIRARADAWLGIDDIRKLMESKQPAALLNADDEPLAWITAADEANDHVPENHLYCTHSASRLIQYPWDVLAIHEEIMEKIPDSDIRAIVSENVHVDGNLIAGINTRILPGVYVEGNVVIGSNCKIGPNCYLRGKTAIGDNCHIGQAVEVKNSIIMDNVSAGHLSYIGDSIIGDGTNLGAGTITANLRHDNGNHRSAVNGRLLDTGRRKFGTVIGDNVHTGIHTSIYPGRKLWNHAATLPGSIVAEDIAKFDN